MREGCEGETVVTGGTERLQALLVLLGSVADVGVPSIAGVPGSQAVHEEIAHGLGQDGSRRNRLAARVTIHQRFVRVADFR